MWKSLSWLDAILLLITIWEWKREKSASSSACVGTKMMFCVLSQCMRVFVCVCVWRTVYQIVTDTIVQILPAKTPTSFLCRCRMSWIRWHTSIDGGWHPVTTEDYLCGFILDPCIKHTGVIWSKVSQTICWSFLVPFSFKYFGKKKQLLLWSTVRKRANVHKNYTSQQVYRFVALKSLTATAPYSSWSL